ncbi:unnamed protein product [Rotaria sp. Silwood2]|nr:unnamed protein product [Rotaria sp. Silwood2]
MNGFLTQCGYPLCLGSRDGTHVQIKPPVGTETDYYNCKKFHSVIMLAAVNSKLMFTYINVGAPERCYKSSIYSRWTLYYVIQNSIYKKSFFIENNATMYAHLMADSVFALHSTLIKQYAERPNMSKKECMFNYRLSMARSTVERAFGMMKNRFRCIHRKMEYELDNSVRIIKAIAILHNICIISGDNSELDWDISYVIYKKPSCNSQTTDGNEIRQAFTDYLFIHSQNCAAGIQLAHAGRKASTKAPFHQTPGDRSQPAYATKEEGGWPDEVVAPSPLPFAENYCIPKEMSLEQIEQFKQDFIKSVERSDKCGFDVLEIHAAHGYLLTEFLSPTSNKRKDQYGGTFENRVRLLLELTSLVRQAWPLTKPLSVRLSCDEWVGSEGWTMDDTLRLIPQLIELGVDIIDTSSGGNSSSQQLPVPLKPGYQVPFSETIKNSKYGTKIMTAPVGLIVEAKQANEIIEQEYGDLVLMAREYLRDPHFPLKAAKELGVKELTWPPQYQRAK